MTAKYTLFSSTTAGDRLLYVGGASCQLSTGDCVMLVHDPATADPNSITLQLVPETAHISPSVIATLNAGSATGLFDISHAVAQALALCVDSRDNIYIVGAYGGTTQGLIAYQAFIKVGGLQWAPAAPGVCLTPPTGATSPIGYAMTWCNTGGGKNGLGHLLVIANTNVGSIYSVAYILDAGVVQQGVNQHGPQVVTNPAFLGTDHTAPYGSNLDLVNDGMGANSGLAISAGSTASVVLGAWGVSSTGHLTTGGGLRAVLPSATLGASTKLRCTRVSPGYYAVAYPSSTNAGQLTVGFVDPTSGVIASTDTGTAGNFPASSATLSWDIAAAAPSMQTLWVYGWSSAANTTMLRLPISFASFGASVGAAVSDDTSVGTATNTTIRTVRQPTDFGHADWQAFHSTSAYSLLGDFSALPTAPNLPVLVSPLNGAVVAATSPFAWAFSSPLLNDAQVNYYLRFHVSGGGYRWWNGSSLTTAQAGATGGSEIAVTSGTSSSTPTLPTGTSYSWSVQVIGASGVVSGYSAEWAVTAAVPPATPTLTATYDAVNNRAVLTVAGTGTDDAWFEYSDDSGATWHNVFGATAVPQVAGAATAYDWWIPSNATRSYRVSQFDPAGIPGNYSAWSSTQTATSLVKAFWLRDAQAMNVGINPHVLMGTLDTSFGEALTEHTIPGRTDTVIMADVVGLEDGVCTFFTNDATEEAALMALVKSQKTLLFQTPDGRSFFTRWNVPRPTNTPYLVGVGSYREHALSWRGQKPPPS
jgi:hypothetical protein